ncbi:MULTISPECIES: NADH-quinone oxidoreductase subunit H [unclassified Shewanella]|uniref:NADH-quinone oxidoreductase subunit H n=1 Tax=unclassified Shewanella TaxID=196818 RepID=UPI0013627A32
METLLKIILFELLIILTILIRVIFITLFERKFLGILNYRKGPNFFILNRFLHSLIDFLKLITKKTLKINFLIKRF